MQPRLPAAQPEEELEPSRETTARRRRHGPGAAPDALSGVAWLLPSPSVVEPNRTEPTLTMPTRRAAPLRTCMSLLLRLRRPTMMMSIVIPAITSSTITSSPTIKIAAAVARTLLRLEGCACSREHRLVRTTTDGRNKIHHASPPNPVDTIVLFPLQGDVAAEDLIFTFVQRARRKFVHRRHRSAQRPTTNDQRCRCRCRASAPPDRQSDNDGLHERQERHEGTPTATRRRRRRRRHRESVVFFSLCRSQPCDCRLQEPGRTGGSCDPGRYCKVGISCRPLLLL
jgi:hypothetical protein